jgi:DNA-binding transcriptional MerR regulator
LPTRYAACVIDASSHPKERLVRIGTVARMTGLPITLIRRLADDGLLPVCRPGSKRHRRFPFTQTIQRAHELMHGLAAV